MGCGNSKVDPTYRSSGRRVDYDDDNDDDNIKEDYILSQRSIAADDAVIGKLTGATDHAEIQVTDSQAFNNVNKQLTILLIDPLLNHGIQIPFNNLLRL
jgi:hypothetical protein